MDMLSLKDIDRKKFLDLEHLVEDASQCIEYFDDSMSENENPLITKAYMNRIEALGSIYDLLTFPKEKQKLRDLIESASKDPRWPCLSDEQKEFSRTLQTRREKLRNTFKN